MNKIKLVRNDSHPQLIVSLHDDTQPVDISTVGDTPRLKFRETGATSNQAVLVGTPIPGYENEDGTINNNAPYNVPGKGGRCVFQFTQQSLSGEAGEYEGEIEITFSDGTVQTVYDLLKFKVRDEF